jgi:threonine synthase
MSPTLARPVCNRCTARSTRRLWKYDSGDLPSTACIRRASVRLLDPTDFAASSSENPRVSLEALWQSGIADRMEHVSTEEATAMSVRLAREEGLFARTSTGANIVAALRLAPQLGPDATIVTLMCDTGLKYLSKMQL